MADVFVSALVKEVVGRLTSLAIQEVGLLRALKDDISSLKYDFEQIQAVLEDAEEKRVKDKVVASWLKHLRRASLEVENVLDDISTQALLQRLYKRKLKYKVRAFFSSNRNQYMSRFRIAHKVRDVRRRLDGIESKRNELKLNSSDVATSGVDDTGVVAGEMPLDRETSSLLQDSSSIFGRDEEVEMVIKTICNEDIIGKYENGEIRVYGIWGMGGLGKTTLAQLVYNHETVNKYFEFKCWVYVSEKFQVKEIIKGIIESSEKEHFSLDKLQKSVQDTLRGKKFLIVLDDVWAEYSEKAKWDQLSATLSCGVEGSIVLMTTRSESTSQMFSKVPELQHKLGCLSEEDSWSLFTKLAFAQGRKGDDRSELEPIGREIVKKCKGLPLAVKTLGSLMWSKSSTRDWKWVKDNNIWQLEEINVVPAILKLSYDNLLPHIKRCFAYCCLFPKGYEMKRDVVIDLWVANGLIQGREGNDMYVHGKQIFNCLVWRSFFQIRENEFGDDINHTFKMHDLMHDMARHIMGDDCLVIDFDKDVIIPDEVLHLSSSRPNFLFSPEDLEKLTSLRSVFMFGKWYERCANRLFNNMHLRVLYLCDIWIRELPKSVCKLKHLTYLNLSETRIEVLPESIIYLQNMQVLLLNRCRKLRNLPKGLRFMGNLKHLGISGCLTLRHLPVGIKELTNLRILPRFPVDKECGAKIEELQGLNLLEGELEISRLENVRGLDEAKGADLKSKRLSTLYLQWGREQEIFAHDKVLEGLEPNPCLKELEIVGYMEKIISPTWMVRLSNLVNVTFFRCRKCEHLPALGRFPNFRCIKLITMDSLKGFHDDDINMLGDTTNMFISLQRLRIFRCPSLVSLPCNFPKLEVLDVYKCTRLVSLPNEIQSFKYMRELKVRVCNKRLHTRYAEDGGVDWTKISHIPNIDIRDPSGDED